MNLPEKDGGLKDVVVEANEGEVVLDVIHRVQATQMGDLAVRWNCKAAVVLRAVAVASSLG